MKNVRLSSYDAVAGFNRWVMESMLSLDETCARAQDDLIRQQFVLLAACLEGALGHWEALAQARNPQELISLEINVVAEASKKVFAAIQEAVDVQSQAREEFKQWLEDSWDAGQIRQLPGSPLRQAA